MTSITAATAEDIPTVQRLAQAIWNQHYLGIITREQIDYMLALGYSAQALSRFLHDDGAGLALANVDGMPVGFAAWYRSGEPATSKLDKLYVLKEQQGRGIGRRLIEHVESAARADGATILMLNVNRHNSGSIAAYERCGFSVRDAVVVDIGQGYVMDDYVMAKPL